MELAGLEADRPGRQVQQVIDDEQGQDHPAPAHGPGRVSGGNRLLGVVTLRTRSPVHKGELDGGGDVQRDADEEDDADRPQEQAVGKQGLAHRAEERRIGVDGLRAEKDLEVAEHVGDDEADQHKAGDRHHHLFADHGAPQRDGRIARPYAARLPDGADLGRSAALSSSNCVAICFLLTPAASDQVEVGDGSGQFPDFGATDSPKSGRRSEFLPKALAQAGTTGVLCVGIFARTDLSMFRCAFTSSYGVNANHCRSETSAKWSDCHSSRYRSVVVPVFSM